MEKASLCQFRASLQVAHQQGERHKEIAFVYWHSKRVNDSSPLHEDSLRIMRRSNGCFYLEIGNIVHEGELSELEEILFEWARDEGWLGIGE
jgi:hypothetical protein